MTFRQGERVVLIANKERPDFRWETHNPIWGGDGQYIAGIIDYIDSDGEIFISWENGNRNGYYQNRWDIVQFSQAPKPKNGFFKNVKLKADELDKLVLEDEKKQEIVAVLSQFEKSDVIFEDWGLGEVIEYGKGMTFMFHGPPGTGKTWGAHCMAKAIGTELLVISAAEIQSSEPGAANRNVQQAFSTANREGKILFIDECDSLIFNREHLGPVLGGEVNTLLTEIEKTEGIVILATNRIGAMDAALERRLALILEFPEPDEEQRAEIWKRMLPEKMPLGSGVTPERLAEFELTGGLIKNVLLHAARNAVAKGDDRVGMIHFEKAINRINESKGQMASDKTHLRKSNNNIRAGVGKGPSGKSVDRNKIADLKKVIESM